MKLMIAFIDWIQSNFKLFHKTYKISKILENHKD